MAQTRKNSDPSHSVAVDSSRSAVGSDEKLVHLREEVENEMKKVKLKLSIFISRRLENENPFPLRTRLPWQVSSIANQHKSRLGMGREKMCWKLSRVKCEGIRWNWWWNLIQSQNRKLFPVALLLPLIDDKMRLTWYECSICVWLRPQTSHSHHHV